MLTKNASKIFRMLKKSKNGKLMFDEIRNSIRAPRDELMSACKSLVERGLAEWSDPQPRNGTYLVLTERGRHRFVYGVNALTDFLLKSILVPVVVTLLTLWVERHFSKIVEVLQRLLL